MRTGVLLINLGTPEAPEVPAVRRYLRQFLMDPYVIDIPAPLRWLLVHGMILPRRPRASAALYRKIWREEGSPLLIYTRELSARLQNELGSGFVVRFGMRYGKPSIRAGLGELHEAKVDRIIALPLYPQYSAASTESSVVALKRAVKSMKIRVPVQILGEFYDDPSFIESFALVARETLDGERFDRVIFSFHGLPEKQLKKASADGCELNATCCDRIHDGNRRCYRAQCYQTAHRIAARMDLPPDRYVVGFQSRLGRTPWIKPYTDVLYDEFARAGIKRLAVISPSFVADCLETLEEIAIRGREQFVAAGGEELTLVPSLNSHDAWVSALSGMIRRTLK